MPVHETTADHIDRTIALSSLAVADLFDVVDLTSEAQKPVREALAGGGEGLDALLDHFRRRLPAEPENDGSEPDPATLATADKLVRHVFQWGPYEEADYGDDVDWSWDPCGDIEWVAAVYRFYWARVLASAYAATRDERYANAFVHSDALTPSFLGILMASLYDHQVKTEHIPMGVVHNKAVFEQRGFVTVAAEFPEFTDARRWLELGHQRTRENLLAQTTTDGVQREWSFGYHMGVLRDAVEIQRLLGTVGITVADDYAERVRLMHEYVFAVATPDLATPMFGDASRPRAAEGERSRWPLHAFLTEAARQHDEPRYAALADCDMEGLPHPGSCAFREAGIYIMRSGWDTEAIYAAFHCAPPAISGHDHVDNGTFELFAFGRWLMPDSGFYTYGHDPQGRAWHRRTAVHQTLTLNGTDSADAGRHVLWASDGDGEVLVVENEAYDGLLHRRTVWFVDHQFFVIVDEALGEAEGDLDLHFQLAPGPHRLEASQLRATTCFADANVLVAAAGDSALELSEEEGWWGWGYGKRERRPAFRFRHARQAPAVFATLVVPYRGEHVPEVELELDGGWKTALAAIAGQHPIVATARLAGVEWELGRDLSGPSAWCRKSSGGTK